MLNQIIPLVKCLYVDVILILNLSMIIKFNFVQLLALLLNLALVTRVINVLAVRKNYISLEILCLMKVCFILLLHNLIFLYLAMSLWELYFLLHKNLVFLSYTFLLLLNLHLCQPLLVIIHLIKYLFVFLLICLFLVSLFHHLTLSCL